MTATIFASFIAALLQTQPVMPLPQSGGDDYTISKQDVLNVIVIDQPQLSKKYTVDADGGIAFPLLGRVSVAGKTLRQVEAELKRALGTDYIKNPQVAISIDEFKGRRIFIFGNVQQPGMFPLSDGMTIVEALVKAGAGAAAQAVIVRSKTAKGPLMPDAGGDAEVIPVNLRELEKDFERGKLTRNVMLQDGDSIFVPRVDRNRIFVTGQVKLPNAYSVPEGTTVLQAISLAGGFTDAAGKIEIQRITDGKLRKLNAKLEDIVQPGDTINVRERLF
ncbi:MAG TPA: polysaccharide biosynthesis/export family protein [Vicinamibacterales bacterium]|nr:polysaccharide biosynthesis/export family protein [Vicinamibacterales bacterium]